MKEPHCWHTCHLVKLNQIITSMVFLMTLFKKWTTPLPRISGCFNFCWRGKKRKLAFLIHIYILDSSLRCTDGIQIEIGFGYFLIQVYFFFLPIHRALHCCNLHFFPVALNFCFLSNFMSQQALLCLRSHVVLGRTLLWTKIYFFILNICF